MTVIQEQAVEIIRNMPDEKIIKKLRKIKKKGKNDWPVEAMWNTKRKKHGSIPISMRRRTVMAL